MSHTQLRKYSRVCRHNLDISFKMRYPLVKVIAQSELLKFYYSNIKFRIIKFSTTVCFCSYHNMHIIDIGCAFVVWYRAEIVVINHALGERVLCSYSIAPLIQFYLFWIILMSLFWSGVCCLCLSIAYIALFYLIFTMHWIQ